MGHSQRAIYSFCSFSTLALVAECMIEQHYKRNTYSFYFILFTGLLKDILGEKLLRYCDGVKPFFALKALANTKGSS